jgi:hypothetical protein
MIKRDELASPNGCLGAAADDEPLFVLRANDEEAPGLVRHWAERYRESKLRSGGLTARQQAKYEEALQLAGQMEAWRAGRGNP